MFWPSPQDYNEVIQSPAVCFADPELRCGLPELTALGLPRAITGAFASVYRLHCNDRDVAVRCFLSRVPGIERRYRELSKYITGGELPYTVNFEYIPQGIRVGVKWFPVLKMDWVQGTSLTDYVGAVLAKPAELEALLDAFDQMVLDLRSAGIAHGDLQHGNVIAVNGALRLVDYDGVYVPSLAGMISNENGHANYQHPHRNEKYFGPSIDSFSAWLIHISLALLLIDPGLWERYQGGDECLLFRQTDYRNPLESNILRSLCGHSSSKIQEMARFLRLLSLVPIDHVPLFDPTIDLNELIPDLEEVAQKEPAVRITSSHFVAHEEVWNADNMAALESAEGQIVEDGVSAYQRGVSLQRAKHHDRAVSAFTRCKSRADDDELYLQAMEASVVSLFFLEHYEETTREYLSAQHFRRVNSRARVFEKTEMTDAARQAYLVACGFSLLQDKYFNQAGERFIEALECIGEISHSFIGCQLGIAYQMEGKFALARAQLEVAGSRIEDEEDKCLAFRLGTLLADVDSRSLAERCFKRTLSLASFPNDPLYVESLLGCAGLAIKDDRAIEGLTRMRAARELLDLSPRAVRNSLLCRIGMLLLDLNLEVDSARHFHDALSSDGRCAAAHLGLAMLSFHQQRHDDASDHLRWALRYDPSLIDAHIAKAELLSLEGFSAEAGIHFTEAITLRPKSAEPYLKAGNFFFKKNDLNTAVHIFSEAVARGIYSPAILFRRGLAYARLQEHDAALRDFERCLELEPKHFAAHFNKGVLYKVLRRKTESLASLNEALALRAGYPRALEQRASVLKDMLRFSEAIADCDLVLSSEPSHSGARAMRGLCHFGLSNFSLAAADLEVALATRAEDLDAWAAFIASLGELGENDGVIQYATACLNELLKGKYKSQHLLSNGRLAKLELLFERGKAYARLGRNVDALADFVASDFFHDLRVIRERAVVHQKLGNLELAAEDFASIAMLVRPLDSNAAFQASISYFQSRQNRKYLLDSKFQNLKFLDLFDQSIKVAPEGGDCREAANCWYAKAEQLLSDPSQEAQLFELYGRALRADPDHYPSLIARGRLFLAVAAPQKAISDFIQACSRHAERVDAHIERGKCAFVLRNYEEAIDAFTLAINLKSHTPGRYWRARSYTARGDYASALNDLKCLLTSLDLQSTVGGEPSLTEIAELSLDVCASARNDALQELLAYLDGFSLSADNVPLVLERALLKLKLNLHGEALKDFDHVLKIAEKRKAIYPTDSLQEVLRSALWGRGQAFLALKKLGKARRDFSQLVSLDSNCHFHFGLALICMEEYRFAEAIQQLDQAILFNQTYPDLFLHKATALEKLGQREQATQAKQQATRLRRKLSPEDLQIE